MSIDVTILGTASGMPVKHRFGQTIVLTYRQAVSDNGQAGVSNACHTCHTYHYLLDAGDGASSLLARHDFDHREIAAIFISHMHADHHAGLAQVIKTCMHLKRKKPLTILAPAEGLAALQNYLRASYLCEPFLGFPLHWVSADRLGEVMALPGHLTIRTYPNQHMNWFKTKLQKTGAPHAYSFESYSAVLAFPHLRIAYSGNLNGPQGIHEMADYAEPCDLLIAELAHVDPYELGRFLHGREIGHTIITHINSKWDGYSEADIIKRVLEGAEHQPLSLAVASDGYTYSIDI
ncbi:MAG TPA: MBL fold metallo-hydrolase [Firmicutes bacterium]|nr:MBL fold metallo-hydrolase [Bacillota bacterium]